MSKECRSFLSAERGYFS